LWVRPTAYPRVKHLNGASFSPWPLPLVAQTGSGRILIKNRLLTLTNLQNMLMILIGSTCLDPFFNVKNKVEIISTKDVFKLPILANYSTYCD
jgi:hypothetical protein